MHSTSGSGLQRAYYTKHLAEQIEKIQRRATKLVISLKKLLEILHKRKSLGGGKDGSIFISASYFAANRFAELFC